MGELTNETHLALGKPEPVEKFLAAFLVSTLRSSNSPHGSVPRTGMGRDSQTYLIPVKDCRATLLLELVGDSNY